jgi:uncharacterized coiled-coil DUF342 family protein
MLERLEVTKTNYEETLAIYEKNKDNPEQAQQEIIEVRKKSMQSMQEIFSKHGLNMGRDFYPRGPDAQQVKQERDQYRQEHPEIEEKYSALRQEIRSLREKLREYTGGGPGMRMRPGSREPMSRPVQPAPETKPESQPADQ